MSRTVRARKRILIITQFYWPEPCAASNRITAFARGLSAAADVTVMTGMPNFPWGFVPPPYDARRTMTERDGPVIVRRVRSFAPRLRRGARLLTWLLLAFRLSACAIFSRERYDTVVVSTPPITLALPAMLAAWRHRAKLIVDVRDVFPDMGVRLGVWRADGLVVRVLGRLVDLLYARATAVLAVTKSARKAIVDRGVAPAKVRLLPNGFDFPDLSMFAAGARAKHEFVAVYAGNFGLATGIDLLIETAKRLLPHRHVRFVLIGGGVDAARITARIDEEGLTNVTYLGVLGRSETLCHMRDADVTIAPLRSNLTDAIPSKIFDSFGVGCPVVVSARGEAATLVREAGGGMAVAPEDPDALAQALVGLAADREWLRRAGARGCAFVRERYSRARTTASLISLLERLRCA